MKLSIFRKKFQKSVEIFFKICYYKQVSKVVKMKKIFKFAYLNTTFKIVFFLCLTIL